MRTLLPLRLLGLDLDENPRAATAMAAAADLLWFLTYKLASDAGVSQEEILSNISGHVLPMVYPEAYGKGLGAPLGAH